jgi:hypothetical protein
MNFKSIGLGALATASVVAGTALIPTAAQAGSLAPGSFSLLGKSSISGSGSSYTLSFSNFKVDSSSGLLSGLTGSPVVKSLNLTKTGYAFDAAATANFITGLTLGGESIAFDLNPVTLGGNVFASNNYTLGGDIFGTLRDSKNNVLATGSLGVLKFTSTKQNTASIDITAQAVPSPALIPGAIGLGVGLLRQRKNKADAKEA